MATERQIAANRLNAQHSTGPKTPEGRAAVRLNGVKHGLTAQTLILKGESEADFTALLDSYEAEHDPATPTEETLVLQLAMAAWRLRRLYHAEAAFGAKKLKDIGESNPRLDDAGCIGMINYCGTETMMMFHRQESRLERTFYKALQELQRLRALRPAAPAAEDPCEELALVSRIRAEQPEAPPNRVPSLAPEPPTVLDAVPPLADMR